MRGILRLCGAAVAVLCLSGAVGAATYYVDFAGGDDSRAGTAPEAAFKHCPGDAAAGAQAKATTLQSGDKVVFKGGVAYRSTVEMPWSGQEGKPVVYDGNTAGTFGQGRAVIDG